MAQPQQPQDFGIEFEHLLRAAYLQQPFTMTLPNAGKAATFRMKCYAHWKALRREGLRKDLIDMANALSIKAVGSSLTFSAKEDLWEAQAIRERLALGQDSLSKPNADQLLADFMQSPAQRRLAEIRENAKSSPKSVDSLPATE